MQHEFGMIMFDELLMFLTAFIFNHMLYIQCDHAELAIFFSLISLCQQLHVLSLSSIYVFSKEILVSQERKAIFMPYITTQTNIQYIIMVCL